LRRNVTCLSAKVRGQINETKFADIIDDQGYSFCGPTHKEKERWKALVLTSKPDQMRKRASNLL
jgi:hypothetical protein